MHRVAIVDDSPEVRALWRAELESSGQFAVCAEGDDGRQATEIAATHHPDVMLLDLSMPGLGGMQALPAIVAASPRTRVVILSAMGRNQFSRPALARGAIAFIEKHLPAGSLVARLHEVLNDPQHARSDGPMVVTVEPNQNDSALLKYLLDWVGCRVVQARTGHEALEVLATAPAAVVFVAALLPDMTATQFSLRLRRQEADGRRTPVIVMVETSSEAAMVADDVEALLSKPVEAEALQSALRRHGNSQRSASSESLIEDEFLGALSERIGAETLRDIVTGFRESTRDRLAELQSAVDTGSCETVARLAHQINGSAQTLAAPMLARAAEDLERAAATGSTAGLRERATRVQSLFEDTDRALASSLPRQRISPEDAPHRASVGSVRRLWRDFTDHD